MTVRYHAVLSCVTLTGLLACGDGRDGRTPIDGGATSADGAPSTRDGSTPADGSPTPMIFGNPEPGLVDCAGLTCDTSAGDECCLYYDERDPPGPLHGCLPDCATRSRPSLPASPIACDGPEDCSGNACCNGQCADSKECPTGQRHWCHDSTTCPPAIGCCTALRNGWGGTYGLCTEPTDTGC